MPEVRILKRYCKGCGLCIAVCPVNCLRLGQTVNEQGMQTAEVVETAACTGCLQCHAVCPDMAIEVYVPRRTPSPKNVRGAATMAADQGGRSHGQ
jgi:2-oxoglutarate ferredoxin oxidoreductase subunit delta